MKKISSFVTYIDESGDEGFVFKPCGAGSSRWFVLSALVIRNKNDHQLIDCLAEARDVLKKPRLFPLHFGGKLNINQLFINWMGFLQKYHLYYLFVIYYL